jgi:hypothetical protein
MIIHEKVHDVRFEAFMVNKCAVGAYHKAKQSARTQQRQCPLGQALLVTAIKDVDLQCASQLVGATLPSRQLMWSAHRNSESPGSNTVSQPH